MEQEAGLLKEETNLREEQIEVEKEAVVIRSRKQEMTERMPTLQASQASIGDQLERT
jgi:hypothetical protein